MTVIVGIVHDGKVLIGGDSAGTSGWTLIVRRGRKVFTTGPYVMGFSTSYRMGQILQHSLRPPDPPEDGDLERFMCTTWIDAVREALKAGGWAKKDAEREDGGEFLVGVSGRLFSVDADYQCGEWLDGYAAVGAGMQTAMGALAVTEDMPPEKRVLTVLSAVERHNAAVRAPFHLAWEGS